MLRTARAAAILCMAHSAYAEPVPLSGPTIASLITDGTEVVIDAPLGMKLPITYASDGRMTGRANALGFYLGSTSDSGRWWVTSDMLCHKWQKWFDGEEQCLRLRKEGALIHWRSRDGKTGTATLNTKVAAAPPPPPTLPSRPAEHARASLALAPSLLGAQSTTPKPAPSPPPQSSAKPSPSVSTPIAPDAMQRNGTKAPVPDAPTTAPPPASSAVVAAAAHGARPVPRRSVPQPSTASPAKVEPSVPVFRVVNVDSSDVLNVRQGPSAEHDVIGAIPPRGRGVEITGDCRHLWCPVRHQALTGWANRTFLESETSEMAAVGPRHPSVAARENPEAPRSCLTPAARDLLARIEARFGPLNLVSTCRSGARISGTGRISKHATGNAIDFKAGAQKAAVIEWLLANHHAGGIMTYPSMDHIHVDIGPRFVSLAGGRRADRGN